MSTFEIFALGRLQGLDEALLGLEGLLHIFELYLVSLDFSFPLFFECFEASLEECFHILARAKVSLRDLLDKRLQDLHFVLNLRIFF